jgi:hypothetical protein
VKNAEKATSQNASVVLPNKLEIRNWDFFSETKMEGQLIMYSLAFFREDRWSGAAPESRKNISRLFSENCGASEKWKTK